MQQRRLPAPRGPHDRRARPLGRDTTNALQNSPCFTLHPLAHIRSRQSQLVESNFHATRLYHGGLGPRGVSTRGPCSASKGDGDGARCSAPNTTALSEGEDDKSLICNSWSFISSSCMSEAAVEPRGVETTSTETSFGVLPPLAPFFGLRRRGDGMPVWSVPVVVGVRVEWRGVSSSTATKRITASLDS